MKFIYLFPNPNKYYPVRDEQFIIEELKNEGKKIFQVKRFFTIQIFFYLLFYKPDAIIFSSLNIGRKINWFIKNFSKIINVPIYWWYFDSANTDLKRYELVNSVAKNVTLFFNRDKVNFKKYKKNNINPIWLDQAVPNILNIKKNDGSYDYDVGFFGSLSNVHNSRTEFLKKIDEKFNLVIYSKDKKEFEKLGFKNVKNYVFKDEIPNLVSKIKIILVLNSSCSSPYYWSDRIHIMIGSGAFCLTQNIEGIQETYLPNEHHIIFNNQSEIENLISEWINKDFEREEMREKGYQHAIKNHSYNNRVKEFLKRI